MLRPSLKQLLCVLNHLFTPLVTSLVTQTEKPHPYLGSVRLWKYKATDVKGSVIICILETYLYEVGLVLRKTKIWQTKGHYLAGVSNNH